MHFYLVVYSWISSNIFRPSGRQKTRPTEFWTAPVPMTIGNNFKFFFSGLDYKRNHIKFLLWRQISEKKAAQIPFGETSSTEQIGLPPLLGGQFPVMTVTEILKVRPPFSTTKEYKPLPFPRNVLEPGSYTFPFPALSQRAETVLPESATTRCQKFSGTDARPATTRTSVQTIGPDGGADWTMRVGGAVTVFPPQPVSRPASNMAATAASKLIIRMFFLPLESSTMWSSCRRNTSIHVTSKNSTKQSKCQDICPVISYWNIL